MEISVCQVVFVFRQMTGFRYWCSQGLIQAFFDIGIPISGTLVKTETTIKHSSSILSNQQQNVKIITRKEKIN